MVEGGKAVAVVVEVEVVVSATAHEDNRQGPKLENPLSVGLSQRSRKRAFSFVPDLGL